MTLILMIIQSFISKTQLVNVILCLSCLQLVILVLWRYYANIWCVHSFGITNYTAMFDVDANHIYTCYLLIYKIAVAWDEGIFMVWMMVFVWYMKIMSTIFFIIKKYLMNMTQCLSCFLFDGITSSYFEIKSYMVNIFARATRD